ncbi:MAG: hypothetical protein ACI37Z_05205 [Candidatus Gastranaerophilaceae bacterium]
MKKCIKCGQNLTDNQFICPYCNAPQPNNQYSNNQTYQNNAIPYNAISMSPVVDKTNGWLVFVSVLSPIIGFILSGVKKKTSPKTSKSCLIASIISLVFSLLFGFGFLGCMLLGKVAYNYNEDHPVGGYIFEEKEEESDFDFDSYYEENTEPTESSKQYGEEKYGYVTLNGNWVNFIESEGGNEHSVGFTNGVVQRAEGFGFENSSIVMLWTIEASEGYSKSEIVEAAENARNAFSADKFSEDEIIERKIYTGEKFTGYAVRTKDVENYQVFCMYLYSEDTGLLHAISIETDNASETEFKEFVQNTVRSYTLAGEDFTL